MVEDMLKLDSRNYNSELTFLLNNNVFTYDEYKTFYEEGKLTTSEWKEIKSYFTE